MHKIEHYIAYLKMILNRGASSDDFKYSDKALYFMLCNIRSTLITQKHKKGQPLSVFTYQDIPCINLQFSTIDDCDCVPEEFACKYLKSTIEIPEILMGRIKYLGYLTDMQGNTIDIYDFKNTKLDKYSFTKKDTVRAFIRNKKLFITNNTSLERVSLSAVFYSPEELSEIDCGTGTACYEPYEQDFPMEKDIADALFKLSYEDILKYSKSVQEDTVNNAQSVK